MIHTSESLKAKDTEFENYHYQLDDGDKYQLTKSEIEWLNFVEGRYCIYDHIMANSEYTDNGALVYTIDTLDLSKALFDDGCDYKAVCLSEDTALQAIFFHSSYEVEDN
jgi:hypothetical protein